ncbi:hypothetical protein SOPP22_18345 [Shewanella sp. OPT22]|nr:hypothetical protein SOPP22_18345 [Shewanella sp. OPT22]
MLTPITDTGNLIRTDAKPVQAPLKSEPQQAERMTVARTIPEHRLQSYAKWANVAQAQHLISANQVAEQALTQMLKQLTKLKKQLEMAYSQGGRDSNLSSQMQSSIEYLMLQDVSYQGRPLIDHQLNLLNQGRTPAKFWFNFKSVELTSVKPVDERVSLQIAQHSVSIFLPKLMGQDSLSQLVDKSLAKAGIRTRLLNSGEAIYSCDKELWQQVQSGIVMSGQGQRLPAGETRTIRVQEVLNWQDPRDWQIANIQQVKQTEAKVLKSIRKVEKQLAELKASQQAIMDRMMEVNRQQNNEAQIQQALQQLQQQMSRTPFVNQVTSLMAQANVNRNQVAGILK